MSFVAFPRTPSICPYFLVLGIIVTDLDDAVISLQGFEYVDLFTITTCFLVRLAESGIVSRESQYLNPTGPAPMSWPGYLHLGGNVLQTNPPLFISIETVFKNGSVTVLVAL
jgi:hypothetical protein